MIPVPGKVLEIVTAISKIGEVHMATFLGDWNPPIESVHGQTEIMKLCSNGDFFLYEGEKLFPKGENSFIYIDFEIFYEL